MASPTSWRSSTTTGSRVSGRVDDVVRLEPFADKWRSFGWDVHEVDGHDHTALKAILGLTPATSPRAVIAHTIKGKGVSFMEDDLLFWHYRPPSDDGLAMALAEIRGG